MTTGDLFAQCNDPDQNLLPQDGEVYYHGVVFDQVQADYYFNQLMQDIDWQADKAQFGGKIIKTARKVAWHGERDFRYRYSGVEKIALPWTQTLLSIKAATEE